MENLLLRFKTLLLLALWSGSLTPFSQALEESCKRSGGINLRALTDESLTVRNKQDKLTCSRSDSDLSSFRKRLRADLEKGTNNYNLSDCFIFPANLLSSS